MMFSSIIWWIFCKLFVFAPWPCFAAFAVVVSAVVQSGDEDTVR